MPQSCRSPVLLGPADETIGNVSKSGPLSKYGLMIGAISVIATATGDAVDCNSSQVASPFAAFTVALKPAVEIGRVLPIASGVPLAIGAMLLWRGLHDRRRRSMPKGARG